MCGVSSVSQRFSRFVRGSRVAVIAAAVALLGLFSGSASAQTPAPFTTLAEYSNLNVNVSNLWPIVIGALGGVYLPMILISIAIAVCLLLWRFSTRKAGGH